MIVKIHKRWQHPAVGWLPYMLIKTYNITPEQYAEMHAKSDYANCKYEIVKYDD